MYPDTFSKALLKLPTTGTSKADLTMLKALFRELQGRGAQARPSRSVQATTTNDFEKVVLVIKKILNMYFFIN